MAAPYPGGSVSPGLRFRPQTGMGGLQMNPWRQAGAGGLQGLGAFLMALGAGQPQQAPAAFQAALASADDAQYRREAAARDQELFDLRRDELASEKQDRADKKAAAAAERTAFEESVRSMGLPPDQEAFLLASGPGSVDYKDLYPAPDTDPPKSRTRIDGGKEIFEEWDAATKTWKPVSSGDRWKPEGAGIQVDTNGDGVPDITIGGSGMKPMSDSGSQQTLRGTLIDQALKDIEGIDFDKISAGKTAAGQWLSETGPLGETVAQGLVLNDDEKKLLGAQGKIQEAVISAITGAAYTEEQKRNMRAAMVPLATDGPARRLEKLKAAAQFMRQLDKNSGYNRIQGDSDNDGLVDELPPGFK